MHTVGQNRRSCLKDFYIWAALLRIKRLWDMVNGHFLTQGHVMNRLFLNYVLAFTFGVGSTLASAADYSGSYANEKIAITLNATGATYGGEIHRGDQVYPFTAHDDGSQLNGIFTASSGRFSFSATQQGDGLTLTTGGATYQLHKQTNPLAAAPTATPTASAANPLATYTVVNKTDAGQSLIRELPNTASTEAALRIAFPDLAQFFGQRPKILGGYEDEKNHQSEFVSFSSSLNGQPMKGFVSAKLHDQGAVIFIVFGKEAATHDEWAKLTARPAAAADATAGGGGTPNFKTQMAAVPLTPYSFPDGTGAIGLAEGWTTNAQTESNLLITGPAGQKIHMAAGGTICSPGGGYGNLPIARYDRDPSVALATIIRANSIVSQQHGGPSMTPDKVNKVVRLPAHFPGGQSAQIDYNMTISDQNGPKPYRSVIQIETRPPAAGGMWGYYITDEVIAPAETFEHDLPIMLAQVFSMSENAAAIMAKSRTEIAAANAHAEAQRNAAQSVANAHYAQTKSIEDDEQIKMRTNTDVDEMIRGERTIEDTQTGEQASVNLADVHDIVDNLNHYEPDRYKEIPLRDQFFPMPGKENEPDYVGR